MAHPFRLFLIMALVILPRIAVAAVLSPTALTFSIPENSNNKPEEPFTDDVLLESITFGAVTFEVTLGEVLPGASFYISSNRNRLNAERGDDDDEADGFDDPFASVGLGPSDYETTDPLLQDRAIAQALATRSLTEGIDGESRGYTFNMMFQAGVMDDNPLMDEVPEIVIFERGNNDRSTIRAIIGGTFDNPIYAPNTITVRPGEMWDTGIEIDTIEIDEAQELAAIGIDFSDFGTTETIWGIEISSDGGDFFGQFVTTKNPVTNFQTNPPPALLNPVATVPEPEVSVFALLGLALALGRRRSR